MPNDENIMRLRGSYTHEIKRTSYQVMKGPIHTQRNPIEFKLFNGGLIQRVDDGYRALAEADEDLGLEIHIYSALGGQNLGQRW